MAKSTPTSAPSNVNSSTWGERLLFNLLSYSLVLLPMVLTVLATRYRLFPSPIQSSALIQRFVYGTVQQQPKHRDTEDLKGSNERLLLDEGQEIKRKQGGGAKETKSSNTTLNLIWCFVGLQISYLVWGVLQEKIMTTEYRVTDGLIGEPKHLQTPGDNSKAHHSVITFHDSQFLVFINRIIAFILSIVALVHNRPRQSQLYSTKHTHHQHQTKPQAPLYEYVYCSLSNILSSWCQYEALKYVNFPTQVLSKSCKIIPVMLMSKIMLHKRYQYADYFFALLLSIGMFIFLINQPETTKPMVQQNDLATNISTAGYQAESHAYGQRLDELSRHVRSSALISGLLILALYLAFDSFTSNWQQSLFTRYGISNWQMMAATNFYSIVLTLTSLHQLGTLKPAFKLLASCSPLLVDCLLMSIMSSIGQLFVYYTIKKFGSVIFAVMMTLRQFLAILLSCTIYGHRLTLGSTVGLLLVFCVVGFQMWRKSGKSNMRRVGATKAEASDAIRIQFKPLAK